MFNNSKRIFAVLLVSIIFLPASISAQSLRVKEVINGNVLLLTNGEYVRLQGVDAPESPECLWEKSKKKLQKFVEGKKVVLKYDAEKEDAFGRKLAYVYVGQKMVNKRLVRVGLAKVSDGSDKMRYGSALSALQLTAQGKKRGIWKECQALPESSTEMLSVSIVYANSTLDRGDRTWLQAKTEAGAACSVHVSYAISSEEYAEPDEQTADANGIVYFEWRVDPTTTPGEWPVTIECTQGKAHGTATSTFSIYSPY